jgi:glycosyltransferase involved in cell wall biosynthesis
LYEIIVVDNNSTDNTKDIIDIFIKKFPKYKIHYLPEKRQGLSYARNAGSEKARGKYLAYIDDDAKAFKDWVKNIIKTLDQIKPDILGGPIYPYYPIKKPSWFKDEYATRSNGKKARFLEKGQYIPGSNFIIKKEILKELGGFNPNLGMKGTQVRYGEETRLIIEARHKINKIRIYYNPEIKVIHKVKNSDMNILIKMKNSFIAGLHSSSIFGSKKQSRLKSFSLSFFILLEVVYLFLYGFLFRDRQKHYYFENFIFENILNKFSFLGKLISKLSNTK